MEPLFLQEHKSKVKQKGRLYCFSCIAMNILYCLNIDCAFYVMSYILVFAARQIICKCNLPCK